jgi:hypothetical protein
LACKEFPLHALPLRLAVALARLAAVGWRYRSASAGHWSALFLPRHAADGAPLHLVYPSARLVPERVALLRDQLALYESFGFHGLPFAPGDLEGPTTTQTLTLP